MTGYSLIGFLLLIVIVLITSLRRYQQLARYRLQETFAIIKPLAVKQGKAPAILAAIQRHGFIILDKKKMLISREQAESLYCEYRDRPYFNSLMTMMTSGPSIVLILAKNNAVRDWRTLMGVTDPALAVPGTLRHEFGTSIQDNAVHGADSVAHAQREIALFF
jgi:nucleoside-diphosphate kinase